MTEQGSDETKYSLARKIADNLANPKGIERVFRTGRILAYGDDQPHRGFNEFVDIVVEQPRPTRWVSIALRRQTPYTASLRRQVIKDGGIFSSEKTITIFNPGSKR